MRYVVRLATWKPERVDNVEVMRKGIPHLEVVSDFERDGYKTFFNACYLLDVTGGVMLEDDVQLCRNFTQRAEEVIAEKGPENVISFFESPTVKMDTALVPGYKFFWAQAVYFPPGLPQAFVDEYNNFVRDNPEQWWGMATDRLIAYVLKKRKLKYWRIRPTLVQHLPFRSATNGRPMVRMTPYFIDYEGGGNVG